MEDDLDELDTKLVARLRRTILRILQAESPMTRTALSVQVRPHSEHWDDVLEDLIQRGLVIKEPIIKPNGRAAVSYRLVDSFTPPVGWDDKPVLFGDMTPEEVGQFVDTWVPPEVSSATAASA